ncbi:hypothetical protein GALMADRAFT_241758 [Galerina marginata CBS 339.88]|uniref:Uncharacterized protein n=1 Tax=Galerina marginata (strain CBS 339.88) TaxID=685588 RepID=A0A067TDH1_GALM3|nr:hypothetical protein GALMADRAFT_241758 [Galerina marginata CBS 339.88]
MLAKYLSDQERSGCHFLDSAKYTRAATYALKHLISRPRADSFALFSLAIANLHYLLEQSDGSKELVELAQSQLNFGPLEKQFPEHTRLAKEGISKYLARVSDEVERACVGARS